VVVRELYALLGFKVDKGSVGKAHNAFTELRSKMELVGMAIKAAQGFFDELIGKTTEYAGGVKRMATITGMATDSVQELQYAASASGVSVDALQGAMNHLARLGVRDVHGTMLQLADQLAAMPNNGRRAALAMQYFGKGGADLLPMLVKGRKGLEDLGAEGREMGNVMSGPALQDALELRMGLRRLKETEEGLSRTIAGPAIRALLGLLKPMQLWIRANREFIKDKVDIAVRALTGAFRALWSAGQVLVQIADWLGPVRTGLVALAVVLVTGLISPWLLLGAAVVLALDDIQAFSEGAPSLIGSVRDSVEELWKSLAAGDHATEWQHDHPVNAFFLELLHNLMHIGEVWDGIVVRWDQLKGSGLAEWANGMTNPIEGFKYNVRMTKRMFGMGGGEPTAAPAGGSAQAWGTPEGSSWRGPVPLAPAMDQSYASASSAFGGGASPSAALASFPPASQSTQISRPVSIDSHPTVMVEVKNSNATFADIKGAVQQAIDDHHQMICREADAACSTPEG
jgi:hypothetical protein